MIRTSLLLFTLFLFSNVYSQYYEDLNSYCDVEAFYDYKQCYQGIRASSGEVLLEPQLTDFRILPRDMILVQKDGYFGVLGCDMNYILQPKYESLQLLVTSDMHQVIGKIYWKAELGGKFGVIDSLGNVIVPFEFDMIYTTSPAQPSFVYNTGSYAREMTNYQDYMRFIVVKDDKMGVFDLEGKEIFEAIYERIEYKRMRSNLKTSLVNNVYWVTKNGNEFRVHDLQNKPLFSDTSCSDIFVHPLLYQDGEEAEIIAYLQQDKVFLYRLQNISTGDKADAVYLFPVITGSLIFCKPYRELALIGGVLNHKLTKMHDVDYETHWLRQLSEQSERYILSSPYPKSAVLDGEGNVVLPFEEGMIGVTGQAENTMLWRIKTPDGYRNKEKSLAIYSETGALVNRIEYDDLKFDGFYNEDLPLAHNEFTNSFLAHQRLGFIKKNNKWGALDHTGRVKIDFIYDNYSGSEGFPKPTSPKGYKLEKNGKVGLIDSLGNIIIPFEYDEIISGFTDSLSLLRRNGNYEIINEKEEVLFSGAQEVFMPNTRSYLNSYSRRTRLIDLRPSIADSLNYQAFAVRNDTLFSFKNGGFIKCDRNYIHFENESVLIEQRMLQPSGFYEAFVPETRSFAGPHFYLRLFKDSTAILSFFGDVINRIEGISTYQIIGDYLKVKMEDGRMGILAKDGKSWAIPPKYFEIIMTDETPDKAWVKTTPILLAKPDNPFDPEPNYDGEWGLIDEKGDLIIKDGLLNQPGISLKRPGSRLKSYLIYKVDKHYGLLDSMHNVLLGAQYDWIVQTSILHVFLLYSDSSCVLFNADDHSRSKVFNSALNVAYNGIIPVRKTIDGNHMIGFINTKENLDTEIDWKLQSDVIENGYLEKLFSVGNYAREKNLRLDHYLAIVPGNQDVFRKQNNERLLASWSYSILTSSQAYQYCYELRYLFPLTNDSEPDYYDDLRKKNNTFYCARMHNPFFQRIGSYKRMEVVHTSTWYHSIYIYVENRGSRDILFQFETYLVDNPEELVTFYSLFKNQEKIASFLEEYTMNFFNENQIFSDACPDMAMMIDLMMHNFCLTNEGLKFNPTGSYTFIIPYSELSSYLNKEIKKKVKKMRE